ncbi:18660_t:CDS:2, partial [Racocetra persica]
NASIRDNILFGLPFDHEIYSEVLRVCALNKDLEILEFGDKTEIGEKGITLSGGQKQPVDSHTAKHIFEQFLMGDLMKDRTRILVTHHVGLCLRGAAKVVVMKDGQISVEGSVEEILAKGLLDGVTFEGDGRLISEETRAVGVVGWKYYKLYLVASGGFWYWLPFILLFVVSKIVSVWEEWWFTSPLLDNLHHNTNNLALFYVSSPSLNHSSINRLSS